MHLDKSLSVNDQKTYIYFAAFCKAGKMHKELGTSGPGEQIQKQIITMFSFCIEIKIKLSMTADMIVQV